MSDEDFEDYDSGPYCQHWSDPSDCDEVCERCGHKCCEHDVWDEDDHACEEEGCDCQGFVTKGESV